MIKVNMSVAKSVSENTWNQITFLGDHH